MQVHHEDISGKDSNKKRFEIDQTRMDEYLSGKYCPADIPLAHKVQELIQEKRYVRRSIWGWYKKVGLQYVPWFYLGHCR